MAWVQLIKPLGLEEIGYMMKVQCLSKIFVKMIEFCACMKSEELTQCSNFFEIECQRNLQNRLNIVKPRFNKSQNS